MRRNGRCGKGRRRSRHPVVLWSLLRAYPPAIRFGPRRYWQWDRPLGTLGTHRVPYGGRGRTAARFCYWGAAVGNCHHMVHIRRSRETKNVVANRVTRPNVPAVVWSCRLMWRRRLWKRVAPLGAMARCNKPPARVGWKTMGRILPIRRAIWSPCNTRKCATPSVCLTRRLILGGTRKPVLRSTFINSRRRRCATLCKRTNRKGCGAIPPLMRVTSHACYRLRHRAIRRRRTSSCRKVWHVKKCRILRVSRFSGRKGRRSSRRCR